METEIFVAGQAVVLVPKEELTRNSAPELSELAMHAATTHATVLIVSMRHLSTLPSEGLRVLITLHDMMKGNGKAFRLCEGSAEIRYTLSITNLEQFFGYSDKLDAILEEYKTSLWEMSSLPTRPKTSAPANSDTNTPPSPEETQPDQDSV